LKPVAAVGIGLAVHTFAMVLIRLYGDVAFEIGRSLSHDNDIADIPRLVLIGYVVLGVPVAALCVIGAAYFAGTD
jgi:hypothetical protein